MATREEIYSKLRGLSGGNIQCQVATFISFEKATHTITVQLNNGLKIPGVRLKAAANKSVNYYSIMVPREKTTVLITQVGSSPEAGEYYMLTCDEFETLEVKADKTEMIIDKTGILLRQDKAKMKLNASGKLYLGNETDNLFDVVKELVDEMKNLNILVVGSAGANPLTVTSAKPNPASVTAITLVWEKLSSLLTKSE